jgi:predicted nuclease of predicted toxin-antitoxin system
MRLLLDECVPQRLSRQLQEFEVSHVASEGWAGRRNGDLLRAMRIAGFDVLVTVDRNLVYQQNVASAGLAVIVLHARGNRVRDLLPLLPELRESAARIRSGEIVHLGG